MFDAIETFCKGHEHTIALIEAISTLAAVIVSLVLAHRAVMADRTNLIAKIQIATILHPTIKPNLRFVVVNITNIGKLSLQLSLGFFSWRIPFRRQKWVMLPIDSAGVLGIVPQRTYPFEIKPRASETFYISDATQFEEQMNGIKGEQNVIGRVLFFLRKGIVVTADGLSFRAKGDRGVRQLSRSAG